MQPIAFVKKLSRKNSLVLGMVLSVIILLLVIKSSDWLNPGQAITARTVQKLEEVPILMRHDAAIRSIAFNPHPNQDFSLASSSGGGLIKLWKLEEEKGATEVFAVEAGSRFALSADGRLATGDAQNTAKIWDLTQVTNIFHSLKGSQAVFSVSFSPDGQVLASGSPDGTIKLWDWQMGKVLHTLKEQKPAGALAIAFSPDGEVLASDSYIDEIYIDHVGTIKLWNWQTGKVLRTLNVGELGAYGVFSFAFSADGQTLASQDSGGVIKLWNWRTGQAIPTPQPPISRTHFWISQPFAFSADGHTLVSDSDDGIKLWNWRNGTEIFTVKGENGFALSPDGQTLATVSDNGTIKLWNGRNGRLIRTFQGREKADRVFLAFSPNGEALVSVSSERITLWNQNDGTKNLSILIKAETDTVLGDFFPSVAFSPDSQTLAISNRSDTIRLLPLNYEMKLTTPLSIDARTLDRFFAFSPDQQYIIFAGLEQVKRLRLPDRQAAGDIKAEPDTSYSAYALSPDGQTLAASRVEGPIQLWNLQEGKLIRLLSGGNPNIVFSMAFSPDGQLLASGNIFDRTIQVWNVGHGKLIRTWEANRVYSMVFSPNGQLLVSGGNLGEIQIWDSRTYKKLRTLKGHGNSITALAFSPNGQTLASGSDDETIKLWRVKP